MIIRKLEVCSSCMSPDITDPNCICTYQDNYDTITFEFEECECCGHIKQLAKTDFNTKKGVFNND